MSEEEKPKRKFWQFHLSTLLLMTVLAGGIIWLNLIWSKGFLQEGHNPHAVTVALILPDGRRIEADENNPPTICGWPFPFCQRLGDYLSGTDGSAMCFDLVVGLSILVAVSGLSESLLRRREARKT